MFLGRKTISPLLDCNTLERLNHLYGALVCCILAAVFLALTSLIIVMIFIPIRRFSVPVVSQIHPSILLCTHQPPKLLIVYVERSFKAV